jgi:PAS domain S-box-containing protein
MNRSHGRKAAEPKTERERTPAGMPAGESPAASPLSGGPFDPDATLRGEGLLRSIHQAAPTGIGVVKNRIIEWTNGQISGITGYTPEELKGKSARILYPSDEEFDRVGRIQNADVRSKGTGSIVTVWQSKDRRLVDILLSSTPIDPGDLSAGVVFTALDVTEQMKARDELWRSEEKYRALFENAVMGIFPSPPEGRFLRVNPATAKMCGFDSPEEMIASITDIASQHYVDPAERDLFIRAVEGQGFVRNFEHRTYRKDGSVFWVSVNARAVRDRRGRITHYEGTHEDIQARKEAEEALRASEERFMKVFQSNPIPMTIATLEEGRILDVNDRAVELSGYSREELIGRTSVEIGLWARPEERDRLIAQLRKDGSLRDGLAHFRTRAGKVAPALWSADRIRLGDREVILTTIHDISKQVEDQEKLRESEAKYRLLAENVTDVI